MDLQKRWVLLIAIGAFFCSGVDSCQPTIVTLTEPQPSILDVKVTVMDYDPIPWDGKVAVIMKFTDSGKPVHLQGYILVTCNGNVLPFEQFWQSYADRVPLQPVDGTYHFEYTVKDQHCAVDVKVPPRPVITSPAAGPPNQGPMVVIRNNLTIRYVPGNGIGVNVSAGDGKTGLGGPGMKADNGLYDGFDVTALQSGPGRLGVTRRYEYSKSGTSFKSAVVNYSSSADLNVTWLLPIDQMLDRCPTEAEIAAINTDLVLTFDVDPTLEESLVCTAAEGSVNLSRLQERTYQALLAMQRIQFDTSLPWTNKALYTWLTRAIKGIRFRSDIDKSFCCDPPDTINILIPEDTPNNFCALATNRWIKGPDFACGLRDFVVLLVHEARHNEGKPHTCNRPENLIDPDCNETKPCSDNTLSELGAWGVQYYLLKWLADHSDQYFLIAPGADPQFYRTVTDDQADGILNTRFCTKP
jgi:hypothetical protein